MPTLAASWSDIRRQKAGVKLHAVHDIVSLVKCAQYFWPWYKDQVRGQCNRDPAL